MPAFLCFTLWAPLASFGDVAVGERRLSLERPGRSALLGLLAAASGIERADQAALDQLAETLLIAVRSLRAGTLLEDYHTTQVPPARRSVRHATRRDELAAPALGTILSRRDYRQEPWHEVAVTRADGDRPGLERLAGALRAPGFTLSHGRKSCPLGLPPDPQLLEGPDLGGALAQYQGQAVARSLLRGSVEAGQVLHADVGLRPLLGPGWRVDRVVERRDVPVNRRRWQFRLRQELVAVPVARPA
jgi:CRISPR system Cascade subunit CasD